MNSEGAPFGRKRGFQVFERAAREDEVAEAAIISERFRKSPNMAADPFERKLGIFLKEWDHVQFHIGRFDTIIFNIRQWAVTVFTAFLGGSITLKSPQVMLYAILPITLFWFLDALHKSFQRRFIYREREIERYLSSAEFDVALNEQSLKGIITPRMSIRFGTGTAMERFKEVVRAALLRNVALTYVSILMCCLITYVLTRFS